MSWRRGLGTIRRPDDFAWRRYWPDSSAFVLVVGVILTAFGVCMLFTDFPAWGSVLLLCGGLVATATRCTPSSRPALSVDRNATTARLYFAVARSADTYVAIAVAGIGITMIAGALGDQSAPGWFGYGGVFLVAVIVVAIAPMLRRRLRTQLLLTPQSLRVVTQGAGDVEINWSGVRAVEGTYRSTGPKVKSVQLIVATNAVTDRSGLEEAVSSTIPERSETTRVISPNLFSVESNSLASTLNYFVTHSTADRENAITNGMLAGMLTPPSARERRHCAVGECIQR